MSKTYEVYLPVSVLVEVDDDGVITTHGANVDWEGMPWPQYDKDSIYDPDSGEWTGHDGDEDHPLWDVECAAEASVR